MSVINTVSNPEWSDEEFLCTGLPHSARSELRMLSEFQPSHDEHTFLMIPHRPLGKLSDFVCEVMPTCYEAVRSGASSAEHFFNYVEEVSYSVSLDAIDDLVTNPNTPDARLAAVDLAFAERTVCVAYGGPTQEYRAKRANSRYFNIATRIARAQGRQVFLQWSDISNWYPVSDPRTFLLPGPGQDQEILLYRIQSGIERTFQRIVCEWPKTKLTEEAYVGFADDLDAVVQAMIHLSRVRNVGEFDTLNHFLTLNGEAHGHATGSFSAWSYLAGHALTGTLLDRLSDPENRFAFDPDARRWIDAAMSGDTTPLKDLRSVGHVDPNALVRKYRRFLEVHRGAVRKHARGALAEQAPSDRTVSNLESMGESIDLTRNSRKHFEDPERE